MSRSAIIRAGLTPWTASSGDGFSDAASQLQATLSDAYTRWISAPSRERAIELALGKLDDIAGRTSEEGWDGYDAPQIPAEAYDEALQFLQMLPAHLPVPEIIADPTGAIAFEWYVGPNRSFTASLHGNRSIEFVGLFAPGNEDYGRTNFALLIPPKILESLSRFY